MDLSKEVLVEVWADVFRPLTIELQAQKNWKKALSPRISPSSWGPVHRRTGQRFGVPSVTSLRRLQHPVQRRPRGHRFSRAWGTSCCMRFLGIPGVHPLACRLIYPSTSVLSISDLRQPYPVTSSSYCPTMNTSAITRVRGSATRTGALVRTVVLWNLRRRLIRSSCPRTSSLPWETDVLSHYAHQRLPPLSPVRSVTHVYTRKLPTKLIGHGQRAGS